MPSTKISELKSDIEELSKFINLTTRPKVKEILSLEVRKIETEIIKLKELTNSSNEVQSGISRAQSSAGSRCYDVKLTNYAWDQSDKFVKLFVTLKNVQSLEAEQIFCKFSARSVELRVNGLDNRNYFLVINNLLNNIDETKSHWKVKTDMVIVYLSKSQQSVDWKHLTLSEQKLKDAQKKDIDDMNPNDDPSQGLMNLMKKMYTEGDDDMKRTIAKAWCEGREKGVNTLD